MANSKFNFREALVGHLKCKEKEIFPRKSTAIVSGYLDILINPERHLDLCRETITILYAPIEINSGILIIVTSLVSPHDSDK